MRDKEHTDGQVVQQRLFDSDEGRILGTTGDVCEIEDADVCDLQRECMDDSVAGRANSSADVRLEDYDAGVRLPSVHPDSKEAIQGHDDPRRIEYLADAIARYLDDRDATRKRKDLYRTLRYARMHTKRIARENHVRPDDILVEFPPGE